MAHTWEGKGRERKGRDGTGRDGSGGEGSVCMCDKGEEGGALLGVVVKDAGEAPLTGHTTTPRTLHVVAIAASCDAGEK
jgi:hypothetical protein